MALSQAVKRFERMQNNPRDNWDIDDIEVVCNHFGIQLKAPRRGSHYTISHKSQAAILTIPRHRKIKAVYIIEFVSFVDDVVRSNADGQS